MSARAVWKGKLHLGDEPIPLKLYSAVEDRRIHFRLLHARGGDRGGADGEPVRVRRRLVDPSTGDEVAYADALRGAETDDGGIVILHDEELEALEPEASREIRVLRFVDRGAIPPAWYDRPYWLGPDGGGAAREGWSALTRALEETEATGIVRWAMRNREYVAALSVARGVPRLVTLRDPAGLVDASALEPPAGREPEEEEVEMARRLVDAMSGAFEHERWEDTWRGRVRELLEAKAEGKTLPLAEFRERREEGASLREALEASLEAAGGERRRAS